MSVLNYDNEIVLHCSTCGSSFFEKDGINHISGQSARKLADDAQGQYVLGNQKMCPKDKSPLSSIENNPQVAKDVTLLECPTCSGIFAYPDDLLKYKKVKEVKVDFVPVTRLLPPPKAIFMLATFAVLSLAVLFNMNSISENFAGNTKAHDIISKITFTTDDARRYLFLYFKTETPFESAIEFTDRTSGAKITKKVSAEPKTLHQLTTTDVNIAHEITYRIILSKSGEKDKVLEEQTLQVK